ncbi:PTS sugar transporter subunit IIA [candidate division TA06 bacterium]|uniref:PTS sugar transporter subunit IIA n=1 Tax=candidate division TA06 bacterium TaxID=2250710 RepID=A0A523UNA6_UNCT6|nr:MAG: PTS sugar transporter subunit IIA [candidate division TA06 bacterium]
MRLVDHLRSELIELDLQSRTKNEVLRELSDLLPIDEKSKEMLIETLKKREELGSTGVSRGIAIPHCRSLLVKKLYVILGRSKKGIDFKSLDGKPVYIFFLIVAPPQEPSNQYLIALGKVAQMARELSKKKEILEIEDKQQFLRFLSKLDTG